MSEFKPIISHQEGQNLFPGIPTLIKGQKQGTSITMKNTKPQIALTPYGASYMQPNMEYNFAGSNVLELPQAQMGGQDQQDQLMQLIQAYAQMKGMKPEELIQKLQSLPKEQQQQAVQAIAQEVQQAMAQQQQAAGPEQQEAMTGQQDQEGVAEQQEEAPMAQTGLQYNEGAWQNPKGDIDYYRTVNTPTGPRVYQGSSPDLSFAMDLANFKVRNTPADSTQWKTLPPHIVEKLKKQQDGGEPCIDCFDHYNPSPQAQDLNWYYKQTGGDAFPQANEYPEDWADYSGNQYQNGRQTGNKSFIDKTKEVIPSILFKGDLPKENIDWPSIGNSIGRNINKFMKTSPLGMLFSAPITLPQEYGPQVEQHLESGGEAFPQAQTYLPYDRPGETRPNFMFQKGGWKEEYGPYKDKAPGGAGRTKMTRDQYLALRKQYGDILTKYGQNYMSFDEYDKLTPEDLNLLMHQTYDEPASTGLWESIQDAGSLFGNSARHLFNKTFDTHFEMGGESDIHKAYQIMKKGGFDMNPKRKKGGKFNHLEEFQKYLEDGGGSNDDTAADDDSTQTPKVNSNALGYYNMMASQMGNRGLIGGLTALGNATSVMGDVVSGLSHPGKAIKNTFGRNYDKMPRLQGAYAAWNKKNPNGVTAEQRAADPFKYQGLNENSSKADQFMAANTTTNSQGFGYSFEPGSIRDPNNPKFEEPTWNKQTGGVKMFDSGGTNKSDTPSDVFKLPEDKKKQPYQFDFQRAEGDIAKLSQIKDFAHNFNVFDKNRDKIRDFQHNINSTAFMQPTQSNDMGDYSTNVTQGPNFRPNSYTYAQKESKPYQSEIAIQYPQLAFGGSYQSGGALDMYQEDGVYDLTQDEIDEIIASGGSVEYL